jgi:hypothetical protein
MTTNICCFYFINEPEKRCENPCNWEIHDTENPNPYENDTYSCDQHLAEMLYAHNTVDFIGEHNG